MHELAAHLEAGAATHTGKVRSQNEDAYLIASRVGLWAVADGMGGHAAGDVASRTLVEELGAIEPPASAADLVEQCQARIANANNRLKRISDERGAPVGTTLALLLAYGGYYSCLWSGDSRIYRIRNLAIEQVSVDHTEIQELISEGKITPAEARDWPWRNVITRAIGVFDVPEVEMVNGDLMSDDTFVICSDGLTAHVSDEEILAYSGASSPQQVCDQLVALTLERGARDNVTVVVVRFERAEQKPPSAPGANTESQD
jgi:serine/threonine protein phosphatase PrpC